VGLLPNFFPSYCDTNWLQGMALSIYIDGEGRRLFSLLVNRSPGAGSRSALKGVCHKIFDHLPFVNQKVASETRKAATLANFDLFYVSCDYQWRIRLRVFIDN
jgi:hypothetical protein